MPGLDLGSARRGSLETVAVGGPSPQAVMPTDGSADPLMLAQVAGAGGEVTEAGDMTFSSSCAWLPVAASLGSSFLEAMQPSAATAQGPDCKLV